MDVWGAIVVLFRRFYLTIPLAAITLFGAYAMTRNVAPEYHASATMILIGPTAPQPARDAPPPPVNPFVQLGTATVATTMVINASNAQSEQQIQAAGGSTDYKVTTAARSPIINIATTSKDAQQALSTAGQLVTLVQQNLAGRQRPYTGDPRQQITAQVLASPQLAGPDTTSRTRAEAIAIGSAVVVTILLVLLIDGLVAGARRRREEGVIEDEALARRAGVLQDAHADHTQLEPAPQEIALESGPSASGNGPGDGERPRTPLARS